MALLNEEQIQDLYLQLDNVSSTSAMQTVIKEWNEKQQPAQFEPDWSNAPDYAVGAAISLAWVTESGNWGFGGNIARFDKPAPAVTPHPHAEMMAKYAEVAARRVDPWVEFEGKIGDADALILWQPLKYNPAWLDHIEYRYIGDDK